MRIKKTNTFSAKLRRRCRVWTKKTRRYVRYFWRRLFPLAIICLVIVALAANIIQFMTDPNTQTADATVTSNRLRTAGEVESVSTITENSIENKLKAELEDRETNSSEDSENEGKEESTLKSFLAGGIGGVCTVIVGHPLDLIKVRMQTASTSGESSGSALSILVRTFRKEGFRGLYRGVSAPLSVVAPLFAVSFWGYDVGQRFVRNLTEFLSLRATTTTAGAVLAFKHHFHYHHHDLSLFQKCIAGALSAIPCAFLSAPSERIKCLLQTCPGQYKGTWDCAVSIYRTGGFASIFKGTVLTLLRDIPGTVAWFGTYEALKVWMMHRQNIESVSSLSPFAVMTAGGLAGMACWLVSIPADVLKSRFQSAPDGTYRNIFDVLTRLLKEEGIGALYSGIGPAMLRAYPANAACFLGMEVTRQLLHFMD